MMQNWQGLIHASGKMILDVCGGKGEGEVGFKLSFIFRLHPAVLRALSQLPCCAGGGGNPMWYLPVRTPVLSMQGRVLSPAVLSFCFFSVSSS